MKTLYRTGGQDYCHHDIIKAAVAAVLMTEVRAGAGPHRLRPYAEMPLWQNTVDATYSVTPPTRRF